MHKIPSDGISIIAGTDGTCPQSPQGIRREGPREFRIYPSWRSGKGIDEEDRGLGFRFGVVIRNNLPTTQSVDIVVDWQIPEPHPRRVFDFLYYLEPKSSDWRMCSGHWDFPVARFQIDVRPGETWIGLNPRYNTADLRGFLSNLRGLKRRNVTIGSIGRTREGRDIPLIIVASAEVRNPSVLITARMHPYESSGSFVLEGMVEGILNGENLPRQYNFHIVPMVNIDGVYNGLSRLTDLQGINVNRVHVAPDPTHKAIESFVRSMKPHIMIDLHHFLEKSRDDARCTDGVFLQRLARKLPDQSCFGKGWHLVDLSAEKTGEEDLDWCRFAAQKFGSVGLLFELPWYRRNGTNMRLLGRNLLEAVLKTDRKDTRRGGNQ